MQRSNEIVVHLVTGLGRGGTEGQLVELLGRLSTTARAQRVVVLRGPHDLLDEVRTHDIEPSHLPLPGSLASAGIFPFVARLAARLRDERAALVHCHDLHAMLVGVPAARLARVPVIAARRDLGHDLAPAHRLALRAVLPLATRVVANSQAVAASVRRDFGIHRIVVIPNGIDVERFDARAAREPEEGACRFDRGPIIVTVGNLTHPAKGHDDLIAASALVRARLPEARFLIVGGGPREGELRAACRRLGADTVSFLGRRGDVPAILARAQVVCHPARAEGMPNAVLEAMAAGRPIVATEAGGTPELVRHAIDGLLVPVARPEALAAGILALLEDPERASRLGRSARERVQNVFSAERLGARIEGLYDEILARSPRSSPGRGHERTSEAPIARRTEPLAVSACQLPSQGAAACALSMLDRLDIWHRRLRRAGARRLLRLVAPLRSPTAPKERDAQVPGPMTSVPWSGTGTPGANQLVRVKALPEILATLNPERKLKGLSFMEPMASYCGRVMRVRKRVERIYDDGTAEMRKLREVVILEGAICEGAGAFGQESCDRSCYYFFKTDWLEPA